MAAAREWWLTPVPTPIFALSFSGSALVAFKVAAILSFVYLTNRFLDLGERVGALLQDFGGYRGVLIFSGLWVVCLVAILAAGFLPRLWLRVVFAIPLLAGALVGSAYEDVAGSEFDYDQVLLLREGTSNAGSAVPLQVPSVLIATAHTLVGAAGLLLPFRLARAVRRLWVALLAAVAGLPFVVLLAVIVARGGYGVGGLPLQYKAPGLFLVAEVAERMADIKRRPVALAPPGAAPGAPHVVFVIDDGVRGDHLDLNVQRGTTPALLRYRDRIANFGHAVSAANCGPASNLMLRTGAMPADLAGGAQTNPYVWSYARRAGMRTVHVHPPWGLAERAQRTSVAEQEQIDETIIQRGDVPLAHDLDAVEVLGELLARDDRQFILLEKSAIYFPYEIVFPTDQTSSHPFPPGWERPLFSGPPVSYDNAVTWHVDRFFENLFLNVRLDDAVLFYTSSHGQNLSGEGGGMPACSTRNTSPLEGLVPMLVATDQPDWRQRFEQAAAQNLNRTSHFNLFSTLLALFGYDREQVAARFEPSLLDSIEAEYGFTTGLVTRSPRLVVGSRTRLPIHRIPREVLDRGGDSR